VAYFLATLYTVEHSVPPTRRRFNDLLLILSPRV